MRGDRSFDDLIRDVAQGHRAWEIGCSYGVTARHVADDLGASYVLGVDLASDALRVAKTRADPGRIEFEERDALELSDEIFEVIYGRSILHHIDYRPFLTRAYEHNLAMGGRMVFMEPLGHNLLTRGFHRFAKSAHTPDEKPLMREDLHWIASTFPRTRFQPVNYTSYPLGIASSFVFRDPENWLTCSADRIDRLIEARLPRMHANFRQVIIAIDRPRPQDEA
jgi:SAM-dependent methyltransferase